MNPVIVGVLAFLILSTITTTLVFVRCGRLWFSDDTRVVVAVVQVALVVLLVAMMVLYFYWSSFGV